MEMYTKTNIYVDQRKIKDEYSRWFLNALRIYNIKGDYLHYDPEQVAYLPTRKGELVLSKEPPENSTEVDIKTFMEVFKDDFYIYPAIPGEYYYWENDTVKCGIYIIKTELRSMVSESVTFYKKTGKVELRGPVSWGWAPINIMEAMPCRRSSKEEYEELKIPVEQKKSRYITEFIEDELITDYMPQERTAVLVLYKDFSEVTLMTTAHRHNNEWYIQGYDPATKVEVIGWFKYKTNRHGIKN